MIRPVSLLLTLLLAVCLPATAQEQPRGDRPAPSAAPSADPGPVDLTTLPSTLMMTVEDMIAVENTIADGPLARIARDGEADPDRYRLRTPLYLSAIIYSDRNRWTVWINGHAFRPDGAAGSSYFDILTVSPDSVVLSVPWGEGGTKEVSLAPHQTFVPRIGSVVEGRVG